MNKILQMKFINDSCPLTTHHFSKRKTRHNFFSNIQTEIQAYLLGFYAADGSINEKRKTFRIHLLKQDSEIVNLYKDIICPDARTFVFNLHIATGRNNTKIMAHKSFGVDINSSLLCNSLVNLGYGYNKSYIELKLPNINYDLIRHFIRGYFDGDGCFCGWYNKENGKKDRIRYYFSICGKTKLLLSEIKNFFEVYNIKVNINYIKRDNMYRLMTSSKKNIYKIFHLLYDDSNFYLLRKFNKFNYYVNTEVSQIIADYRNALRMSVNESNNSSTSTEHESENIC